MLIPGPHPQRFDLSGLGSGLVVCGLRSSPNDPHVQPEAAPIQGEIP